MPIITFQGLPKKAVKKYYQQVDQLGQLIDASRDNIFFVFNNSTKLLNKAPSACIQIEWLARKDKEELLVQHLRKHFSNYVEKIAVIFTEVNGKLFIDDKRLG